MPIAAGLLASDPAQLLPARELMAFTLASHIILVPFGVALPFITLVMHYRGLRRGDAVALRLFAARGVPRRHVERRLRRPVDLRLERGVGRGRKRSHSRVGDLVARLPNHRQRIRHEGEHGDDDCTQHEHRDD